MPESERGLEPLAAAYPTALAASIRARFDGGERAVHRALGLEERRVWAAFEPDVLWRDLRRIVRIDYIQLCLLYMGLWMMTFLILVQVPYVGPPLLSVLHFYITIAFAFVFGHLVGLRRGQPPPQVPPQPEP